MTLSRMSLMARAMVTNLNILTKLDGDNPKAFTKVVDGLNLKTLVENGYTSSLDGIIDFILWWLKCMITMGIS
jgi:hypothetical protein